MSCHSTLKTLAAAIWYLGALALLLKGGSLLREAHALLGQAHPPLLAASAGLLTGVVKDRYIFSRSCKRNLKRIDQLARPRPWQFFRLRFFFALGLMITTGGALSRLAQGNVSGLLCVGGLDLALATALLLSSRHFWRPSATG